MANMSDWVAPNRNRKCWSGLNLQSDDYENQMSYQPVTYCELVVCDAGSGLKKGGEKWEKVVSGGGRPTGCLQKEKKVVQRPPLRFKAIQIKLKYTNDLNNPPLKSWFHTPSPLQIVHLEIHTKPRLYRLRIKFVMVDMKIRRRMNQ